MRTPANLATAVLFLCVGSVSLFAPACGAEETCLKSFDPGDEEPVCTAELPVCITTTLNGAPLVQADYECGICLTSYDEGGYKACPKWNPTCNGGRCCGGKTGC